MNDNPPSRVGLGTASSTKGGTNPPRRILVVEDDADIRLIAADALIKYGYEVDTATDGAAAWDALHRSRYDLLITDNVMPKMSGAELVSKVRSTFMALPVIMASGTIPDELKRQPSLLAGVLIKPFTTQDLVDTANNALCATEILHEPGPAGAAWL